MQHHTHLAALSLSVLAATSCAQPDRGLERTASAVTVCAAGATTLGVDVSHWNGTIDWTAVKAAGKQFAIMKATEGTSFVDAQFATNWSGAAAAGMVRGAYHFFRPAQDAAQQAAWVISTVGALGPGDLPIVIDLETTDSQSAAAIKTALRTFVDAVALGTGKQPIIFTSPSFWNALAAGSELASQPLWVMHWGVTCPDVPSPWSNWTFWMTTDSGSVTGIAGSVDLDVFNGDLNALKAFANPSAGPDAGADASATADASAADAGSADAVPADTGATDAVLPDTGNADAGGTDTGSADTGAAETAHADALPTDLSYASDGGATDAGRDAAAETRSGGGSSGCGCATATTVSPSLLALALAAAALVILSRRRRVS